MKRIALVALLLVSFQDPLEAQSRSADLEPVQLKPGDKVRITVWQQPDLSGDFEIAGDGTILHPLYREIRVTDVPVEQVEGRVRGFLSRLEANPNFVIQPLLKVAVIGAVIKPEVYELPAGTTVAQAVTGAGGPAEDAKRDEVRLTRNGSETEVDLSERGVVMTVRSGDQIMVAKKGGGFATFREAILPVIQIASTITLIVWRVR